MATLSEILVEVGLAPTATVEIPGRPSTSMVIPTGLHASVKARLEELYPQGLYRHQSMGIQSALDGADVCLATSTASGKTTVFTACACHYARTDPGALTIAVYPARALVQDQHEKWQTFCAPLGVRVGRIDGGVLPVASRLSILKESQVVLMTPDVIHAWLMNNSAQTIADLRRLRLVVLDEAHSYNGVFGTNMAYLFRRLSVLAAPFQIIVSTATIGKPEEFITQLTGRDVTLYRREDEASQIPTKRVCVTVPPTKGAFDSMTALVRRLAEAYDGRFLAFADSRKLVERLTAAAHRNPNQNAAAAANVGAVDDEPEITIPGILMPYRAGYETDDRNEIQNALAKGLLKGVVSTSALELGIDIGDIDLVLMLNTPPSVQAFWQRFGRAGRRSRPGECLVLDDSGTIAWGAGGLDGYMRKEPECNYLYLGNRYVQYTNALCAARELQEGGGSLESWSAFPELPSSFMPMLSNEVNPTSPVPDDLYPLKQRAENGAHYEFPLRGGIEANYQVKRIPDELDLGTLTLAQLVREAYPGAIYYYKATPYRIRETRMRDRLLRASREKFGTTKPDSLITVFPNFASGGNRWASSEGFMQECEVQVAERVTGFTEIRGSSSTPQPYGIGSSWAQRPVQRFLKTTGVVWSFEGSGLSERAAEYIMDAFCLTEGIHSRDVGVGRFSSKTNPNGSGDCKGWCIYDDVAGGLRLTERLAHAFSGVLTIAIQLAATDGDLGAQAMLNDLADKANCLKPAQSVLTSPVSALGDGWITVIAPNQPAVMHTAAETVEVAVVRYVVTPTGLKYRLRHLKETVEWTVEASAVSPINGLTKLVRYNVETGEEEAVDG